MERKEKKGKEKWLAEKLGPIFAKQYRGQKK